MTRILKERKFSGTTDPKVQPWELEHRKVARRAAAEGIVLLKNEDHILPLKAGSKVALYGAGAGRTIKGGTGSGDVNERERVSVFQGMKNAGFEIQITELDATINAMQSRYTLQDQANYYYSIIKMLKQKKQGGANITGVTFWGLSDQVSWRASGQPLLFSQLGVKKAAYDAVIHAMK